MKIIKDKNGYILYKKGNSLHLTIDEAHKFSERFERDCEKDAEDARIEWLSKPGKISQREGDAHIG